MAISDLPNQEKIQLRHGILDHLAEVYAAIGGAPELGAECRCPECGEKLRMVVAGATIAWCPKPCGWYVDMELKPVWEA